MAVTYPSGEDKISWFDGTAVTITDALLQFCGRMELDTYLVSVVTVVV